MIEARLRFRHRGCYSERLPEGTRVVHLSGDALACLTTIQGPPAAQAVVLAAMADWIGAQPEIVGRGDDWVAAKCTCPRTGLTPTIGALGAFVLFPVLHERGLEWWNVATPDRPTLDRVVRELSALGDVTVERLVERAPSANGGGLAAALGALSAKQLAALRLAIRRGYYAEPRRATLASLAKEMGLARSTYAEHLRKAERGVMERFAADALHDLAIALAPVRRPGRPPGKVRQ